MGIEIDQDRCKGCALCTTACPRNLITLKEQVSEQGFPVARFDDVGNCAGCALCASICPDIAIKVFSRTWNSYSLQRCRAFSVVERRVAAAK
ncbi:MAG: ferredoxin family protein [Syntrophotaleaceae bacterium]